MRSTANSPPTWRCAWRRRRARTRASSPPPSSRRCRRVRCSRAPRWPAPASSTFTWPRRPTRASSRASTRARVPTARARSVPASACWWSSCRPTPPVRCTSATAARQPTARRSPTSCAAAGYRGRARVLHQRCRPADGHPRRQRLGALPRGLRARCCRFRRTATAATTCARWRSALQAAAGASAATARRQRCSPDLPADAPAGDKEAYIDALIARCRELIGADGFRQVLDLSLALHARRHPRRPRRVRRACSITGPPSARSPTAARSITRSRCSQSQGRLQRKDGALWFRASEFGDEKDRVVVRENGQKTYFASDIAYHLAQVRARLHAPHRRARAPITTATWRACAPGSSPWASPASASRRR